jgi:hypothetical protein
MLTSSGVLERRLFGGIAMIRFSLDPVAEYLAAIQSVIELRHLVHVDITARVEALMMTDGYPGACDGYLKAFASCYRNYQDAFGLPTLVFPWED